MLHKDIYRSIPPDHTSENQITSTAFLLPAYKQKLKRDSLSRNEVQCWAEAAKVRLRDCLGSVDWTVFKCLAENLDECTTTVMDFVGKCVEGRTRKKSIRVFPNCKPWMNQEMHSLLKTGCAAFKSGDPDQYKKSRYDIHKAIREAKRRKWFMCAMNFQ
eukprot:g41267.t1